MDEEMQRPTRERDRPATEVVQRFLGSLRDLHVEAHVVKDAPSTAEALRGIFSKSASKSVVVAGIPPRYAGAVKPALAGMKVDFVEDLRCNGKQQRARHERGSGNRDYQGHFGDDQRVRHIDRHGGGTDFDLGHPHLGVGGCR